MSFLIRTPRPTSLGNHVKENEMEKARDTLGREENECWILVGKCEGNRSFGKSKNKRNDDAKIHFKKNKTWEFIDWIHLAQNTE
jgi:hypothetical protein